MLLHSIIILIASMLRVISKYLMSNVALTHTEILLIASSGIRMFSYPWDGSDKCTSFATIGRLNKVMADRTAVLLKQSKRPEVGSCRFNLTLINKCYPINGEVKMKLEPTFQKEKCTVSWHADSTLEHYSSIAVYHCTKPPKTKKITEQVDKLTDDSWRISLRVSPHAEGPKSAKIKSVAEIDEDVEENNAPPLAVPLPNKFSYYLLDDFNHHHQHSGNLFAVCTLEGLQNN